MSWSVIVLSDVVSDTIAHLETSPTHGAISEQACSLANALDSDSPESFTGEVASPDAKESSEMALLPETAWMGGGW